MNRSPILATSTPNAFTLVELLVVMVLVAALSGIAIYSVQGHIDGASLADAADRLETFDRQIRARARQDGQPITFSFNPLQESVSVKGPQSLRSGEMPREIKWNSKVQVGRVRLGNGPATQNTLPLTVNGRGQSKNYAVQLVSKSGASTWLITLGLSGQQLRCKTEDEVDALLRP
ncbi:MAG: prepilin-type N-terminal cleavage/methylation domain-containing protein [Pirellulaceae bacterium]|nr:prepilin-type N-terminal cleavage/methylation domain-containing protein [Pirellulaceae bacterium]